jgi:hypothetical protein
MNNNNETIGGSYAKLDTTYDLNGSTTMIGGDLSLANDYVGSSWNPSFFPR